MNTESVYMNYRRHKAIAVSSSNEELIEAAHKQATELFPWVTPVSPAAANGTRSFFVPPDGNDQEEEDSRLANAQRSAFISWLKSQRLDDRAAALHWVEVHYGNEDGCNFVSRNSGEHLYLGALKEKEADLLEQQGCDPEWVSTKREEARQLRQVYLKERNSR